MKTTILALLLSALSLSQVNAISDVEYLRNLTTRNDIGDTGRLTLCQTPDYLYNVYSECIKSMKGDNSETFLVCQQVMYNYTSMCAELEHKRRIGRL